METKDTKSITVETRVKAPVQKVWQIWTQPDHIMQWNSASEDWHTPSAENDLRTGGKFSARMEAKDKSMGFDFGGVYTNVEEHRLIEYKMDDDRKVKITFSSEGNETKVTETFDAETMNDVEMQRAGWQAILDNFKKYTESLSEMVKLKFSISINALPEKVYHTMIDKASYSEWTSVFNPTSRFEGSWEKGKKILFVGEENGQVGGMVSRIADNVPGKFISIQHLGILKGKEEITSGPEVEGWGGAFENYSFSAKDGGTFLQVEMDGNKEYMAYFENTWPEALKKLKNICEKS